MNVVDLAFAALSTKPLLSDHGYPLYGALSRALPAVHQENGIGIHPIRGQQIGNRQITLLPTSRLVLRASTEKIHDLIQLAAPTCGSACLKSGHSARPPRCAAAW